MLSDLESEIARLSDLALPELRKRWRALYGRPAPKFFRRKLLIRAVAYQMQVKAYGGLSDATKQRLVDIAEAVRTGNEEAVLGTPRIKPGTRLIRLWKDETHTVEVRVDGFEWGGRKYSSLSGVAKAITGTNWNGYTFFGVKRRPSRTRMLPGRGGYAMSERAKPKTLRCAIYTRKSSEEGLEQDFNSLHAQREACEAYIKSQRHEGWIPIKTAYDDGGYSGGTLERPALQKLLEDIRAKKIDVVVVYKVDRLTRALSDFAKIVEVFDAQGVSFVSVTQQFNTTSSMGRLTLNVLLSFAQFEREVTGERIRDKIAASKKKGMWMGGWVPIGYDLKDRTLFMNKAEAKTVQTIFRLYRELKNVRLVEAEIHRLKLKTKRYIATTGRAIGGRRFRRGHIYWILSNPIYIGEIGHKGARHTGQHPAIIDRATWEAVQAALRANTHGQRTQGNSREPNLLAGLLFDDHGNRLISTHTFKNGKQYRYYVAVASSGNRDFDERKRLRFPAAALDSAVLREIAAFLGNPDRLIDALRLRGMRPKELKDMLGRTRPLGLALERGSDTERRAVLLEIAEQVTINAARMQILLRRSPLALAKGQEQDADEAGDELVKLITPVSVVRRGSESKLLISGQTGPEQGNANPSLAKAIARAHVWFTRLAGGKANSVSEIARKEGLTERYVARLLPLAFLAPRVVDEFLEGRHAPDIATEQLTLGESAPLLWRQQIAALAKPSTD